MINYAHTGWTLNMPNPSNWELYGSAILNNEGGIQAEHVSYVPNLNGTAGGFVLMARDGEYLKMVSQDSLKARNVRISPTDIPSVVFDPTQWNNYNNADGAYLTRKKMNYDPTKETLQYIKIIISKPVKIRKIYIRNRNDCCQDRIGDMLCKTINSLGETVETIKFEGSSIAYTLDYYPDTGLKINVSPPDSPLSYSYLNADPTNFWVKMDGGLVNCDILTTSNGVNFFVGSNSNSQIYIRYIGTRLGWNQIARIAGTQISVSPSFYVHINSAKDAFFANSSDINTWAQITGKKLKQIKVDDKILYGLDENNKPWYTKNISASPEWTAISSNAVNYITGCNNKICMINTTNELLYSSDNGKTIKKIGTKKFQQIDMDKLIICGIDLNNNIFYTDINSPTLLTNPVWVPLPGMFNYISVRNGNLVAIDSSGGINITNSMTTISGYSYKGCYNDRSERALTIAGKQNATGIIDCMAEANSLGYNLVGIQAGRYCFYGNDGDNYSKYGKQTDATKCFVDSAGDWTNVVYGR